ncbi:MAG: polyprenyl synthetase family protein [Acidobacteriota bacterium]
MEGFDQFVRRARHDVQERLSDLLEAPASSPPHLVEAMRYAVLGPGKRIRPLLVIAAGEASSSEPRGAGGATAPPLITAACALEMVHTFSLIHDDLPALDNDDLRRGRPTLHVRFGEAMAVLAGDALLNLAYHVLSHHLNGPSQDARARAIAAVCRAVGLEGMIAGQVLDLEYEGRPVDSETLHRIHSLKTGALIRACCQLGAIVVGASGEMEEHLAEYGRHLGLAFQIVDDILDVEGSSEALGKSPGKDARAKKATFPAMWGIEGSRRRARAAVASACEAIAPLGPRAAHLSGIARAVLSRKK